MRKRVLQVALLSSAALAASLFFGSTQAAAAGPRIRPVPSLQPAATQRLWQRLVDERATHAFTAAPDCRPLRAVFYAQTDWLRLATKLAANASPCAQYYISIPPLAAAKAKFRSDQAWRIRALGPSFHALAEVHVPGWRAWIADNNSTWYDAGVEARRRMAAAGFDVSLGDGWIVNELSSGVRRGTGTNRQDMREFVRGLYDGDGGPKTKGGVFDIGVGQGLIDPSTYKSQLESWFRDDAFWSDMSRYVSDWAQELYGDARNYGVTGAPLAARRDYLDDYLRHQLVHVRLGGAATAAARSFLETADSPLANAAWQWGSGFGWTMVSAAQMADYVSAQVYALRHFSALDGEARDHWGFAWAPQNATGIAAADFGSQTGAILDRLAAAIRDSGQPFDASDPGIGACGGLWCGADVAGAWFNDAWKAFTYWGQLELAFASPAQRLSAGAPSGPIVLRTLLDGAGHGTPSAMAVKLASSSAAGRFSTSRDGPWATTLTVTIPAGGDTTPAAYYEDTTAGSPVLTASALGTTAGTETVTVDPGPAMALTVSPASAVVPASGSQTFTASAVDAYGNSVPSGAARWSVRPAALGTVSPASGGSTTFRARKAAGAGSVVVSVGALSAAAPVTVAARARAGCLVPRLRDKTLRAARRALSSRHCTLGRVRHAYSRTIRRGRVVSQSPRAGAHRTRGARVRVVVSRGRRRG